MSISSAFRYKDAKRRDSATKLPPINVMNSSLLYKVPSSNSVLKGDHSLKFLMEPNDHSGIMRNLDNLIKSGQSSTKNNPLMSTKSLHESLENPFSSLKDKNAENLSDDKQNLKIKSSTGNFQLKPIAKNKLKNKIEIDVKSDIQSYLNNIKLKDDNKEKEPHGPSTEKVEKTILLRKNSSDNFQLQLKRNSPVQRKNKFSQQTKPNSHGNASNLTETPKSNSVGPLNEWIHNNIDIPRVENSRHSNKKIGFIKAYAANTHQGLVRNYNEDRVSIVLNISKPPNRADIEWPMCSFFAIYDGHGGTRCAEFLRDNLHNYVVKDKNFPANPKLALRKGFETAETSFLELAQNNSNHLEKSGSCALVVLVVDDICYVANVGDSRAFLSMEGGTKILPLSRDHKPSDDLEKKRILEAGGKLYQTQGQIPNIMSSGGNKIIMGPLRVLPGRLSVSRTFGDVEAKISQLGGNPKVVIAEPEIFSFKISSEYDFILMGCDGIFDKLTNKSALQAVWNTCLNSRYKDVHEFCARGVESLMRESLTERSLDNVTVVMLGLKNLKATLFPKVKSSSQDSSAFKSGQSTDTSGQKLSVVHRSYQKTDKIPMQQITELAFKLESTD